MSRPYNDHVSKSIVTIVTIVTIVAIVANVTIVQGQTRMHASNSCKRTHLHDGYPQHVRLNTHKITDKAACPLNKL